MAKDVVAMGVGGAVGVMKKEKERESNGCPSWILPNKIWVVRGLDGVGEREELGFEACGGVIFECRVSKLLPRNSRVWFVVVEKERRKERQKESRLGMGMEMDNYMVVGGVGME